ncbi:hypothetical protein [Streptomyces yaizuensis]|uniref:Uncharacterized protein n=1 Tax=Streptomyces yaizuensis TaxID=2989713 RepID=A0ABQ5NSV9_9ACTN|nr:hypothetical protein [Streptomyces sp. YSPA8]GLF93096.1 hypothetical protein SYYSPA8_02385 [Streptomyces sp. YSPA8]
MRDDTSGRTPERETPPDGPGPLFRLAELREESACRHWWRLAVTDAGTALTACHRLGAGPAVPGVLWLECAAGAASALLSGPVRAITGVRFHRPLRPRPGGGLPALRLGAQPPVHPPTRGPAAVRVVIETAEPDDGLADPADGSMADGSHGARIAEATVHIGPLAPAPAAVRLPRLPALPSVDPCQQPGGPVLLGGPFTALTRLRRHPWGGTGEFSPATTDPPRLSTAYRLPLIALDCLLRMQCQPPLPRGDLLPAYTPLRLASVEFFTRYDDDALGAPPVLLVHRPAPAPDTGVLTAVDPAHTLLRVTVAANRLLGRFDSRTHSWEQPSAHTRPPARQRETAGPGDGHARLRA